MTYTKQQDEEYAKFLETLGFMSTSTLYEATKDFIWLSAYAQ